MVPADLVVPKDDPSPRAQRTPHSIAAPAKSSIKRWSQSPILDTGGFVNATAL